MVPDAANFTVVKERDAGGKGLEDMDIRRRRVVPQERRMRKGSPHLFNIRKFK